MCGASDRSEEPTVEELCLLHQTLAERLHDGPLQELVALQIKAANLARLGAASADDQMERLMELGALAQAAIDQLHEVIRDLTADPTEQAELFSRLLELCEQFRSSSGIYCVVHLERGHTQFPGRVGDVVYRTVRELLANVRKHAQATEVEVKSESRADGAIAITVADNGIGMPMPTRRANPFQGGGFGLWSIEHRLAELGAILEIQDDHGLAATIVLPRKLTQAA
jgi:two-component system sensor histidine kinase DegS